MGDGRVSAASVARPLWQPNSPILPSPRARFRSRDRERESQHKWGEGIASASRYRYLSKAMPADDVAGIPRSDS